jgi:hypothetical protein
MLVLTESYINTKSKKKFWLVLPKDAVVMLNSAVPLLAMVVLVPRYIFKVTVEVVPEVIYPAME